MKEVLTHIGAVAIAAALLYFFYFIPEIDKSYKKGLTDCEKDTVYLPGKDSTVYRDTSFHATKPVKVKVKDSVITAISSYDTTFVSGKDTLSITSTVIMKLTEPYDVFNNVAEWFSKVKHKDFVEAPDTIKIYETKEVPVLEEIEWYRTDTFAYIVCGTVYILTLIVLLVN